MSPARNSDGTFKSAIDIAIERHEAEWNAEINAKMDAGMSFDEAHIAAGGDIIPTTGASPESVDEISMAYAKVGRTPP